MGRGTTLTALVASIVAAASAAAPPHPHILFITADDLGYDDLGALNGGLTITPAIDALRASGLVMSDYHTFKICSPSRASVLSGRFPFNVGFYDMSADDNHQLVNTTLLPELLRSLGGYATHALGKYGECPRPNSNPTLKPRPRTPQTHPNRIPTPPTRTLTLTDTDVGYMVKETTPTYKGFDSFYGYYRPATLTTGFTPAPAPAPTTSP